MTREEAETGDSSTWVFVICVAFIYLILAALYESLLIPFAVILSVPFGLAGSFLLAWTFGLENNIYMQTGVIMLIGLQDCNSHYRIRSRGTSSRQRHKDIGTIGRAPPPAPDHNDISHNDTRTATNDFRNRRRFQRFQITRYRCNRRHDFRHSCIIIHHPDSIYPAETKKVRTEIIYHFLGGILRC